MILFLNLFGVEHLCEMYNINSLLPPESVWDKHAAVIRNISPLSVGSDSVRVGARHIGEAVGSSAPRSWAVILLGFLNCFIYIHFFIFSPTLLPTPIYAFFFLGKITQFINF